MKILRSKKALSPVIATIILIAVTVAVSIAVAAWMGALTFSFMATQQGQITNLQFGDAGAGSTYGWVLVTFNNTGTTGITITSAYVNGLQMYTVSGAPIGFGSTVPANSGAQYNITATSQVPIVAGAQYTVTLESSKGNKFTSTGNA